MVPQDWISSAGDRRRQTAGQDKVTQLTEPVEVRIGRMDQERESARQTREVALEDGAGIGPAGW